MSEGGNGSKGSDAPEVVGVRRGMFGAEGSGLDAGQFTEAIRRLL